MSTGVRDIVEAVKSVLPERRPIQHHEPFVFDADEAEIGLRVVRGGNIQPFEEALSRLTGSHVVATSSGTAALMIALRMARVGPGDEVLVPSSTFVATANAVSSLGATPHFADGVLLDPAWLREYVAAHRNIRAIAPVHLFGHMADAEKIRAEVADLGVVVIEDAAQAVGSRLRGQHAGTMGHAGVLSFNDNKTITTRGGGALLFEEISAYYSARRAISQDRSDHPWLVEHGGRAFNFRICDAGAALGLAQLKHLDDILASKRATAYKYRLALRGTEFFYSPLGCESNYWLNVILVDNRDDVLSALHGEGILARASFTPLHMLDCYRDCPRSHVDMKQSEEFWRRAVCLPSGANLFPGSATAS